MSNNKGQHRNFHFQPAGLSGVSALSDVTFAVLNCLNAWWDQRCGLAQFDNEGDEPNMKKFRLEQMLLVALTVLVATGLVGAAEKEKTLLRASLDGIHETNPSTIITDATGTLLATINDDSSITYTLSYNNMSTPVTQAHIHIGATKITGGIVVFFCTNLGNGPAGTPTCPNDTNNSGTVTHTVTASDVVALPAQGVAAGDMKDVVRAIVSGVAYANVHTTAHPAGEIRGQIRSTGDEDDELPGADHHHR